MQSLHTNLPLRFIQIISIIVLIRKYSISHFLNITEEKIFVTFFKPPSSIKIVKNKDECEDQQKETEINFEVIKQLTQTLKNSNFSWMWSWSI